MSKPNTELDRLAAARVMGFVLCDRGGEPHDFWGVPDKDGSGRLTDRRVNWSPSTRWADAGEVVERMESLGFYLRLYGGNDGGTPSVICAKFTQWQRAKVVAHGEAVADNWPLAITRAALLALGVTA